MEKRKPHYWSLSSPTLLEMGKRAALLLTGALVEMVRLEGQEWGHQGSTGESN